MAYCKKGTRKCVNGVCYKKKKLHHFSKKKLGRCAKGTRRCKNLKCHRKN
jgi:hypothetical protein